MLGPKVFTVVEVAGNDPASESSFKSESTTHSYYLNFDKSLKTVAKQLKSNPFF